MGGGGKLPPRQKMINIMYLVLTALLAMNVSKDVLNAFVVVNEALAQTNESLEKANGLTYSSFAKVMGTPEKVKAAPYNDLAQKAKKMTEEMNTYIQNLKVHLVEKVEQCPKDSAVKWAVQLASVTKKDNYDIPTAELIGDDIATPHPASRANSAAALEAELLKYRKNMLDLFADANKFKHNPKVKEEMNSKIGLVLKPGMEHGQPAPWASVNFYHLPLAAVITNLTKVQSDVKNAEAEVLDELFGAIGGTDIKFDRLEAKVIAPSSYIIAGDEYKANVLLVASSSTSSNIVEVGVVDTARSNPDVNPMKGAGTVIPNVLGMGEYKRGASGEGIQKWGGVIKVAAPGGAFKYYPFQAEYMVAKPAVSVSPDKMNVFYIGVPNPVTVSAAGIPAENMMVSMSGGSINIDKRTGKGTVTVSAGTEATVNVSAKIGAGTKALGSSKFRIKRLPDPVGFCGGKKGDCIMRKNELVAAGYVFAKMENFDFDLKVTVASCDIEAVQQGDIKTIACPGGSLSAAMGLLQSVKPNQKVYITNVKARMPDGSVRPINGLNIKVQ
ncbi:MAG: gliding motility protein GldM [Bacteroidia bacterium]|nr:gliding motility protein GldM [Bacteroidia bacterium]